MNKSLLFLTLIASLSVHAATTTMVTLVDSCSRKPVVVTSPHGNDVWIRITGLESNENVYLTADIFPTGLLEDQTRKDRMTKDLTFRAFRNISPERINRDGTISYVFRLPSKETMYKLEQKLQSGRVWNISIKWYQKNTRSAGSADASFYRVQESKQSFFQVVRPELCQWETQPAVSSKLHDNQTSQFMNVEREYINNYRSGKLSAVALGPNYASNFMTPLASGNAMLESNFGWLFNEWQKSFATAQTFAYSQKYVLPRYSSGVFAKRQTFTRNFVNRWVWVADGMTCGEYKQIDSGHLDVGVETENFYEIPRTMYGNSVEMSEFMNLVRPGVNTCTSSVQTGEAAATEVMPNGFNGIMFYYKSEK